MKPFFLTDITTNDGLIHKGMYVEPTTKGKRAVLWIHGLTSTFYNGGKLTEELIRLCDEENMGFAAFNNRGHDIISGGKRLDANNEKGFVRVVQGSGYEVFEESVHDIDAGISFLVEKGYTEVVVIGHSTGAAKVCYYAGTVPDHRVAGVVLAGALSDRFGASIDQSEVQKNLATMRALIAQGKGDELVLGYHYFPLTPKRYVSLFGPGSAEDVFDYGEKSPKLTAFQHIHGPLLVITGEHDEYADRPVSALHAIYDAQQKSSHYKSTIIPGGSHGFDGVERETSKAILQWMKNI